METHKKAKVLKVVTTVFLPLSVISISLFAIIGYGMVWIGSSGFKKRYYNISAVMYFIEAVFSLIKLYLLGHFGVLGRSFAYTIFGKTPFFVFWIIVAVIMTIQGMLSINTAKSCTDNGSFFE
ncbi:MAG: hypothetical protein II936_01330 [Oscillospiraceae bacterium]|nr:hypothetical protein [Oscillospiraceae bacterium]